MNKVLIRADASNHTGAGHLMRCVALGQYLRKQGVTVRFVTLTRDSSLREYLTRQDFEATFLEWAEETCGTAEDIRFMLQQITPDTDWVILDNYYFDYEFQKAIRGKGIPLMVVDDHNERMFDADIVLNQAIRAYDLRYEPMRVRKFLLGSSYVMIRQELIQYARQRTKTMQNVLITLGGSVQEEVCDKIIAGVQQVAGYELNVKVVSGFSAGGGAGFRDSNPAVKIERCQATLDVCPLYDWADLALCAGGGTCWELCFFGVVGVVGALASQQVFLVDGLSRSCIFRSVGWYRDILAEDIAKALQRLLTDSQETGLMRAKAVKLVDGRGTERIYEAMLELRRDPGAKV
ncbi:MAG: UDP-2,4-diacetamido-2,4,6-trideoxy-beta-L-altropyranose hydrolase [Candidatus Omnitrophica bacterium]|nr:UDP-2,4-diacetamido-2,4,6-trideoxy-beta-L-altropyranose hydrolase [Candidatus Omnitrophota bacterium]MDD5671003.1 UDP-2,4-diacetamido-2,4,6-trideoxy-beta-L-altropyranose hydrolase [Candidatus Omnitrophota bacterium]